MPAHVVVFRIDRISDAAFHVDAGDQSRYEVMARNRTMLAEREYRGDHRPGRMNDVVRVCIVVVEHMRADAIDEGGVHDIEPLAPSKNAGLSRS